MFKVLKLSICLLVLVLTGCSSLTTYREPIHLPSYAKNSADVYISSGVTDTWTDVPAGSYLVTGSQIYLTGKEIDSAGLLGLSGILIDKAANSVSLKNENSTLAVRFDLDVSDAIKNINGPIAYNIVKSEKSADISFFPLLYLHHSQTDGLYHEELHLKMKLKHPDTNKILSRTYTYSLAGLGRSIKGEDSWSSNQGEEVKKLGEIGLNQLVNLSMNDISGKYKDTLYKSVSESELTEFTYINDKASLKRRGFILDSFNDHYVIVPMSGGRLLNSYITMVPQSTVKIIEKKSEIN